MNTATDRELPLDEFMDTRYRDYALYVLHSRAIPSCIDGFKPSQRKVVWTANKVCRSSKIKTAALAGAVQQFANYHHGGVDGTASLMAAEFCNNVPVLKGEGNFGSRLVTTAAASRYTHIRLSPKFDDLFVDTDILQGTKDPEDPEPRYYLPLIPWVLVNGANGIAIGYATEIQPRDLRVLARVCADYISGKVSRKDTLALDIPPSLPSFRGTIFKRPEGPWACRGIFDRKSKTQYEISELPEGVDREKYVGFLDKMEDDGKIVSYEDRCTNGEFRFVVRMPNSHDPESFDAVKFFRLERALSENITTIDEYGSLKIFSTAAELLVYFCDFRVQQYQRRFAFNLERDTAEYDKLLAKMRFIGQVVAGDIKLGNMNRDQMRELLKGHEFHEKYHDMLMNVRTFEFCRDSEDELLSILDGLFKDIEKWKHAEPTKWYSKELEEVAQ